MKIGLLTYGMNDNLTGIGQYAMQLSYALKAAFPSVQMVLLNPYPGSRLPWYRDFPVIPVPGLALLPGVLLAGPVTLAAVARRFNLDLIHDPCGIAPFVFPGRYKRIVTIHDAIPFIYPQYYPLLGNIVYRTTVPMARWSTQAVITVSESAKADLLHYAKLSSAKIFVTPSGMNIPTQEMLQTWRLGAQELRAQWNLPDSYFLVVGAGHPRKNSERVIAALALLRESGEEAALVITGTPPRGFHQWEGSGIRFVGHVDELTLHLLYANASGVLVPSYYEGFGFPALEAMGHGTAVVASPVSALPEVMRDTGLYAEPDKTEAWVHAMRILIRDESTRQALGEAGYLRAQQFSWRRTAEQTTAVYTHVLRGAVS